MENRNVNEGTSHLIKENDNNSEMSFSLEKLTKGRALMQFIYQVQDRIVLDPNLARIKDRGSWIKNYEKVILNDQINL